MGHHRAHRDGDPQGPDPDNAGEGRSPRRPLSYGKASAPSVPGARPGESSYGRPRLAWPPAWSAPASGRAGAPQPGRTRHRQRRGPGRRPDRGSAGNSPRSTRSLSPPTPACHRRWRPAHSAGRLVQPGRPRGRGTRRPVPEEAKRSAAGADRGGGELRPAPRLWRGFPCRAVTTGPALLLHRWLQQSADMAAVSHVGQQASLFGQAHPPPRRVAGIWRGIISRCQQSPPARPPARHPAIPPRQPSHRRSRTRTRRSGRGRRTRRRRRGHRPGHGRNRRHRHQHPGRSHRPRQNPNRNRSQDPSGRCPRPNPSRSPGRAERSDLEELRPCPRAVIERNARGLPR